MQGTILSSSGYSEVGKTWSPLGVTVEQNRGGHTDKIPDEPHSWDESRTLDVERRSGGSGGSGKIL